VANLRKFGHVHLTKHFVNVVLEHGAIDLRNDQEAIEKIEEKTGLKHIDQLLHHEIDVN